MRRIFLTAAGLIALLHSYSQVTDSSSFKSRKLKVDEINLVSSYYHQDGNNAAVTGGIGSQKLTDIANVIDVKLITYDKKQRKHSIDIEMGIDHYTSASSDKIDLKANSSASRADTRLYPSLSWTRENESKGTGIGAGLSYSGEYDYQSFGGNIMLSAKTKNRSGEFTARFQAFLDKVNKIAPVELRTGASLDRDKPGSARNTFAASLSYSQIINQQFQIMILGDIIQQNGFLSLPFYRVYFKDGSVHQETLPDNRTKIPLGIRASYFAGDKIILKGFYRFYTDNWGIRSNTANLEIPVKITPFVSVSPFYRYYTQTASKYFAPYQAHTDQNLFYTSNYDLSKFRSSFFGAGVRFAPPSGVFGIVHLSMIEIRYGHYSKNIDMNANIITLNIKVK
ncbi:MAG TPA: DUF3570 domain-containing protein [Flavitalea sp.]|nr:DUF3570 domain-containing protein [Flavitalea sp.]